MNVPLYLLNFAEESNTNLITHSVTLAEGGCVLEFDKLVINRL